jgi:hypothetical protein
MKDNFKRHVVKKKHKSAHEKITIFEVSSHGRMIAA